MAAKLCLFFLCLDEYESLIRFQTIENAAFESGVTLDEMEKGYSKAIRVLKQTKETLKIVSEYSGIIRFLKQVSDRPRRGRPAEITPGERVQVMALACTDPGRQQHTGKDEVLGTGKASARR
jgi:hypothetical protein